MNFSDWFYFNKSDRTVLWWLIILTACIAGLFYFADDSQQQKEAELSLAADSARKWSEDYGRGKRGQGRYGKDFQQQSGWKGGWDARYYKAGTGEGRAYSTLNGAGAKGSANLHPFDLNVATPEEMLDLGFTEREVGSVMKYRSKGGVYRRVEQLAKISGMTKGEYDRLAPFFYVSDELKPAKDFVKDPADNAQQPQSGAEENNAKTAIDNGTSQRVQKIHAGETIPLNASDTTELKRVPGIGSVYAAMIVKYRERLGGFYSIEQLHDLQALPSDLHRFFRLDPVPLRKIQVNKLSVNHLVNHPYLNYYKAVAIKEYIRLNGALTDIRELRLNRNFTEQDILRLEPYFDYTK